MVIAVVLALLVLLVVAVVVSLVVGTRLGRRRETPVVPYPTGPSVEELARRAADDSIRVYMEQALAQQRQSMEQALAQHREILEQERRVASGDLDAKKSLIDQQVSTMSGELGKVEALVRSLEVERTAKLG